VQVDRLDDALPPSAVAAGPVLVKIDVESHEPEVLAGAHRWIKTRRPAVVWWALSGKGVSMHPITVLCLGVAAGASVLAKDLYVSNQGRDGNPGTREQCRVTRGLLML
jgi:hypothetical protein